MYFAQVKQNNRDTVHQRYNSEILYTSGTAYILDTWVISANLLFINY